MSCGKTAMEELAKDEQDVKRAIRESEEASRLFHVYKELRDIKSSGRFTQNHFRNIDKSRDLLEAVICDLTGCGVGGNSADLRNIFLADM